MKKIKKSLPIASAIGASLMFAISATGCASVAPMTEAGMELVEASDEQHEIEMSALIAESIDKMNAKQRKAEMMKSVVTKKEILVDDSNDSLRQGGENAYVTIDPASSGSSPSVAQEQSSNAQSAQDGAASSSAATTESQPSESAATKNPSQMTPAEQCRLYGHSWKTHQENIPATYEMKYVEGGWNGRYVIRDYDDFYYAEFGNRDDAQAYADRTGLYVSYVQPHHCNSYKLLVSPETTKTVSICKNCGQQK